MHIDPELRQFCTARQLEILEAIELHGSSRGAARALGIDDKTVRDAYKAVLKKAELQGHSPAPDMVATYSKSDLRRMAEGVASTDGKVVKT